MKFKQVKRSDVRPGTKFKTYPDDKQLWCLALRQPPPALLSDKWGGMARCWHVYLPSFDLAWGLADNLVWVEM